MVHLVLSSGRLAFIPSSQSSDDKIALRKHNIFAREAIDAWIVARRWTTPLRVCTNRQCACYRRSSNSACNSCEIHLATVCCTVKSCEETINALIALPWCRGEVYRVVVLGRTYELSASRLRWGTRSRFFANSNLGRTGLTPISLACFAATPKFLFRRFLLSSHTSISTASFNSTPR